MEINGIELKIGTKIKIYGNKKALGVPKGNFTIKRLYKINNDDHIELKDSRNASIVGKTDLLKLVEFKKI